MQILKLYLLKKPIKEPKAILKDLNKSKSDSISAPIYAPKKGLLLPQQEEIRIHQKQCQ